MLEPSIKELLKHVNTRYMLVNVTASRAREISEDAEARGTALNAKPVSMAINEIVSGRLNVIHKQ